MSPSLYIGNKNYSSWSLRAWVLMRERRIPFEEHLVPFGSEAWDRFRQISPAGKVPCLVTPEMTVWESLAIAEYLAERYEGIWPCEPVARAWSRAAAAEMHAGFLELRSRCSMSCGVRMRLHELPPALETDIARLTALWAEGMARFGGPYLAGPAFTAVDAFFAPVAFRVQTYELPLEPAAGAYVKRLLDLGAMREWYAAALGETFRDEPHEQEIARRGTMLKDLRARASHPTSGCLA